MRVGKLQIEVLPKLATDTEPAHHDDWRNLLLDMLLRVGQIKFRKTAQAVTSTRNTILDIILWHYLTELEQAIHQGLIKRYRVAQGNLFALKGKLLFNHQMRHNLVHAERFYTAHTRYDFDHALNQLLAAALTLVPSLTHNLALKNSVAQLALAMPPISEVPNPAALADKIVADRKSAPFTSLITLARLIVERHHPNLSTGGQETFSLMFDMNTLFEEWLRVELNAIAGVTASKKRLPFFDFPLGKSLHGEPDLVVRHQNRTYVLDAKWKRVDSYDHVSIDDLRQIYTYLHLQEDAIIGGLVYPLFLDQNLLTETHGRYHHRADTAHRFTCGFGHVPVVDMHPKGLRLRRSGLEEWFTAWAAQEAVSL